MSHSINWVFTAKQYLCFGNIISVLVQRLASKENKTTEEHIYQLQLLKLQKNMSGKMLYAGYYPDVDFKLKLDYISALTFWECCSWGLLNDLSQDSLESVITAEVCRNIHQKLLTK